MADSNGSDLALDVARGAVVLYSVPVDNPYTPSPWRLGHVESATEDRPFKIAGPPTVDVKMLTISPIDVEGNHVGDVVNVPAARPWLVDLTAIENPAAEFPWRSGQTVVTYPNDSSADIRELTMDVTADRKGHIGVRFFDGVTFVSSSHPRDKMISIPELVARLKNVCPAAT